MVADGVTSERVPEKGDVRRRCTDVSTPLLRLTSGGDALGTIGVLVSWVAGEGGAWSRSSSRGAWGGQEIAAINKLAVLSLGVLVSWAGANC